MMIFAKRILIIDDEPDMVEFLSEMLTSSGYVAISTTSAAKGLVIASSEAPDLIVCDINMPALSGFHVLRLLKDHPNTADIPVILMSGDELVIAPEGIGVLAKPFQTAELLGLIDQQLRAVQTPASDAASC
jgi:CheY-like chemotaxis protein